MTSSVDDGPAAPVAVVAGLVDAGRAAAQRGDMVSALAMADAAAALAPNDETVLTLQAELRGEERAPSREVGTRRRVTVMFGDLVGSTPLAVSLDPEATRQILRDYHETCDAIIARYDGHISHIMGDGILVIFGFPRAHEDDGLRAVSAALEMSAAVAGLCDVDGTSLDLRMRIGVHTGLAVISELGTGRWSRPGDITGETPNLAARVQTAAEPGTVYISEDTLRLVRGRVICESLGARSLKGIDRDIELFEVSALSSTAEEQAAAVAVGRGAELAQLSAAWRASADARQYVVVSGEAGIGKSHLARLARREAETTGGQALTVRCSALDAGAPLAPVGRFLQAQLEGLDDPLERLHTLGALAEADHAPGSEAWYLLAQLAGVPWPPEWAVPQLPADQARDRMMALLMGWIDRTAADRRLLVVIEDAHWADPTTLELMARIGDRDHVQPMMLLATTRSPVGSAPGSPTTAITLSALEVDESLALVEALTGGRLDEDTCRTIAERGDGVPLYLQELVRMLADSPNGPITIPPTLNDLLVARLDAFPRERATVEMLAVVARPVDTEMLSRLTDVEPATVQRQLDDLQRAGIVRLLSTVEYEFRHALLRDAAYEVQLLARRVELHRRVAEVFQQAFVEGAFDEPHVIAHHFEMAGDVETAVGYWMLAGVRRAEIAAHAEAIDVFEHALQLLHDDGRPHGALEFQCRSALAASLLAVRGYTAPEVATAYAAIREMAVADGTLSQLLSLYGLWAYYHVSGDASASVEVAHAMHDRALRSNDIGTVQAASAVLGYQLMMTGEHARAVDLLSMGRQWHSPVPLFPHHVGVGATANLATALWLAGRCSTARAVADEAAAAADALSGPTAHFTRAYTHAFLASFWHLTGRPERAIEHAVRTVEISAEFGFASWLGAGMCHLKVAEALLGDPTEVIPVIEFCIQAWRDAGAASAITQFEFGLAAVLHKAGRIDEALAVVDAALADAERYDERFVEVDLWRLRGELTGDATDIERAIQLARRQGARPLELRARTSLLGLRRVHGVPADDPVVVGLLAQLDPGGSDDEPVFVAARRAIEGDS